MANILPIAPRPAHVPPELVVDFDVYLPLESASADYHEPYIRLQEQGVPPIFWSPRNGGQWVVTRRDLLNRIFADYDHFSSEQQLAPADEMQVRFRQFPVQLNPPEHGLYRSLFSRAFTLPAVKLREDEVRLLARSLAEDLVPKGRCDFVAEFAQHLPMKVFMGMVDLPESDRIALIELAGTIVGPQSGDKQGAYMAIAEYIGRIIDDRTKNPGSDLISKVATSTIEGRPIERREAVSVCSLLLIGGLDTVASISGHIMHFLAQNPAHRQRLVEEPAIIPAATEEFIRRFAMTNPGRMIVKDMVYEGVTMKKGEMIALATPFGAVDPSAYDRADEVEFDRKSPTMTTFGNGPHRCPGNMLARAEIRVMLEEWMPRIPNFRLDPDAAPVIRTGVNGSFASLPLVWDV
ncbi:MAG: cytochrome P450 [Sphingomicrobium sp.]